MIKWIRTSKLSIKNSLSARQELAARKWHTKKEIPVGFFVWDSTDKLVS